MRKGNNPFTCFAKISFQITKQPSKLSQTIRVIVFPFRAVPYGQIYYREFEKCKIQPLARSGGNFDRNIYISEEAVSELKWWIRSIFDAFPPIKLPQFDLTIFSDTKLESWGGTD